MNILNIKMILGVGGMVTTGGTAAVQGVGQVVKGVGGMFGAVGSIFDGGKKNREKEQQRQQAMAAEQMRLEEEIRMRMVSFKRCWWNVKSYREYLWWRQEDQGDQNYIK